MKVYVGRKELIDTERWQKKYGHTAKAAVEMEGLGQVDARVYVQEIDSLGLVNHEEELRHYPYHSPDGFEWGYRGSGPADLARCILIDYLQIPIPNPKNSGEILVPHYQDFKVHFIAVVDREDGFRIEGSAINTWLVSVGLPSVVDLTYKLPQRKRLSPLVEEDPNLEL